MDAVGTGTSFDYDIAGRLLARKNPSWDTAAYDYGVMDEILIKQYVEKNGTESGKISYTYDSELDRIGMNNTTDITRSTYCGKGNLPKEMTECGYDE